MSYFIEAIDTCSADDDDIGSSLFEDDVDDLAGDLHPSHESIFIYIPKWNIAVPISSRCHNVWIEAKFWYLFFVIVEYFNCFFFLQVPDYYFSTFLA